MVNQRIIVLALALLIATTSLLGIKLEKGSYDLNQALLESERATGLIPVIIILNDQYDTKLLYNEVKDLPKQERRETTIATLKQHSARTQKGLKSILEHYEKKGAASSVRYHWLSNVIGAEVTLDVLKELDQRDEIAQIKYDPTQHVLIDPVSEKEFIDDGGRELPYHLDMINAPQAWQEGYWGQGVVVGVIDTGVNYNHVDLKDVMWTHPDFPHHGYDFVNNDNDPIDDHRHGSHCAGIVAGTGAGNFQTGVAPKAEIMALKGLDSTGSGRESWIFGALEFGGEYKADVLSLSLGWTLQANPSKAVWRDIMDNLLSAGVVVSVAAGNEGDEQKEHPIPSNVRTPGDCPPPWLSPEMPLRDSIGGVITTGASDDNDEPTFFTSLGPVTWQDVNPYKDYHYNPGEGLMKPDIIAPGWNILSSAHNDNEGYLYMSGTSMATPATSGVIALMLSKNPELTSEEICQILEETARKYGSKNNLSGSGRIDVPRALNAITREKAPGIPFVKHPADKDTEILLHDSLQWEKNMETVSYTLYLGTDNPPTNIINGLSLIDEKYDFTGKLEFDTVYYWRVDAHNQYGDVEGDVWSFRTVLPVTIDFESGDFSPYEWDFMVAGQNAQKWYIEKDIAYSGEYSARSGAINNGSSTTMGSILRVKEDGIISFYAKTSTEEKSDYLRFLIDGQIVGEWSGEVDWERYYFPIKAGIRTVRWTYAKDTMNSAGEDAVWIDYITFPRHQKPAIPYVPENLTYDTDYESIYLSWEVEINEDVNPIEFSIQGFNLYTYQEDKDGYVKLNSALLNDKEYEIAYTHAGEYNYAVSAVYKIKGKIVETELSNGVTVTIEDEIAPPAITPESGVYNEAIAVSAEVPEGEIFYTTDGSNPTFNSILYQEPILVEESTLIKMRAYKHGALPSEIVSVSYVIETTDVEESIVLPKEFMVNLYPNPVRRNGTSRRVEHLNIEMSIPNELNRLEIEIYNIKGQLVKSYDLGHVNRGVHNVQWDLKNNNGKEAPNGIYLLKFSTDNELKHRRMMIVR